MKKILLIVLLATAICQTQFAQQPWSQQMATTVMKLWKDSFSVIPGRAAKWSYDQGVILKGFEGIWNATGNGDYFRYIEKQMDYFVQADGSIKGYRPDEYNIDHINNGKLVLLLYRVTGKEKYKKAVDLLRNQLSTHPRTKAGGFWHKQIYPWQMWLDGLYMGQPFYAEYASIFHEDAAFNDITRQFVLMELNSRDSKTGLLYHGYDESREQKWADKKTGRSPNFWGRALGWYGMAMVDVLDYFPEKHPGRDSIIRILNRFVTAVLKVQDPKSGLWYDIVDKPTTPKNYKEASASCMLIYTLAKGVRKGYIPSTYLAKAKKAYAGVIKEFIRNEDGQVNLHGTVSVSGLGGNPYRDGSFEYYMREPVVVNDPKGVGAFIKCAVEMEMAETQSVGKGETVLLDYYFNNEWKKDPNGKSVRYHYTWNDKSNSGFSMFGDIFHKYGVKTRALESAPSFEELEATSIYIIVDPDTEKETTTPNYISDHNVTTISEWVRGGGVLLLMGNDSANAEFTHFNKLSCSFGIKFNEDSRNKVFNNNYPEGGVNIPPNHPILKSPGKIFVKEFSSLEPTDGAVTILKNGDYILAAVRQWGKGFVFAIGDPWIYNEYLDGRRLPTDLENYKGAEDLVKWLIKPVAVKK